MADNICRNCKWAEWQLTKHAKPRIRKDLYGRCRYPMERIAVPCVLNIAAEEVLRRMKDPPAVWHDSNLQCRVWEKKGI